MAYIRGVQSITDYLPSNPINQYHEKLCAYIRKIRAAEILEVNFSIGVFRFYARGFTSRPSAEFLSLVLKKKRKKLFY